MVCISSMLTTIDCSCHQPESLLKRSISVIGRFGRSAVVGLSQSNLPMPVSDSDFARRCSPMMPKARRLPSGMAEAMRNIRLLASSGMSAVVTARCSTPLPPAPPACWRSTNRRSSWVLPEPGTPSISTMPPLGSALPKTYSA